MIRLLLAILPAILMTACGNNATGSQATSPKPETNQTPMTEYHAVRDSVLRVQIPADTTQSYALYIPASAGAEGKPHTIILFADPHGAGRLPIDKYRKLADRFGMALAGSNNSRNGLDATQCSTYMANIVTDLQARLHYAAGSICLAGFSGGSKVALQTAANNSNIKSVIYAGSALPFQPGTGVHLLGFAGTADMNYSDLLAFASQIPEGSGGLVEFAGKHEWPDTAVFQKAFYWLAFRQAADKKAPASEVLEMQYDDMMNKEVVAAAKRNNALEEVAKCREAVYITSPVTDPLQYQGNINAIIKTELYQNQLAEKNRQLQSETNQKQILMQAFQNQDLPYWTKTISQLRGSSSPSDHRLLGFISLGCYSYTSQLIARGDMAGAAHFAAIYELADPDNTDQLYFHAIIAARQGDNAKALKYMQTAANKGFNDWARADAEPAMATVRGAGSFSRLQAASKPGSR